MLKSIASNEITLIHTCKLYDMNYPTYENVSINYY